MDTIENKNNKMISKNILIVDDVYINRILLKEILKKIGDFNIIESHNGKDAIEKLNNDIDLILMDIMMSVMGGIESTIYIRNKLNLTVPIIAVTAYNDYDRELNKNNGFNEIVIKPVDFNDFSILIKKYLQ